MDIMEKIIKYAGLSEVVTWIKGTFVQKETGKGLSTHDLTTERKNKVDAIPANPKYTDTIPDLSPYLTKTSAGETYATKSEMNSIDVTAQLKNYQKVESKGIAGGYASLGADGKVPINQLPDDKDTVTSINGKTGVITKADIVALGIPDKDTNTTYDVVTTEKDGLMSKELLNKVNGISTGADVNPINQIKRNGTLVNPVGKVVDINVPINTSQLNNDSGYLTNIQVNQLITEAGLLKREIVTTLPTTGDTRTIYMAKIEGEEGNLYNEHMYINNKWELMGPHQKEIDLSGYVKATDLEYATSEEIQALLAQ